MAKRKVTRKKATNKSATKKPDVAKEVKQSQRRLASLAKQLGSVAVNGQSLLDSELSSVDASALIGHKQRNWVRDNVPKTESGKFDPRTVVALWIKTIEERFASTELDEITRRKKLAEMLNAEEMLRLNKIRASRLEGKLMPVGWVHDWLRQAAEELRKPIEIIGRDHPEYKKLILNGLDNATEKMTQMLKDDQLIE